MPTKSSKNRSPRRHDRLIVVHILSDANRSGVPSHIVQLADGLAGRDIEFIAIGPAGPLAGELAGRGIAYMTVRMGSKFDLLAVGRLRKALLDIQRGNRSVIVHCHGPRAGLWGRLAARSLGLPTLYTEHSWTADYRLPNRLNHWWQIFILRLLGGLTDWTVAVSPAVAEFLLAGRMARADRLSVIAHGVVKSARPLSLSPSLTLGSVGSLTWQKNFSWLIELMGSLTSALPKLKLEIVGDGPQRSELARLITDRGLKGNIRLLGGLDKAALRRRQSAWRLYLQPSVNESFGLAAAEAMAIGLPVLVSNRGSLPWVVRTESGVFDLADKERAVEKIVNLLKNDEELAKLQRAEWRSIDRFDLSTMLSSYESLYRRLIRSSQRPRGGGRSN